MEYRRVFTNGTSTLLTLPKKLATAANLKPGALAEIKLTAGNKLTITRVYVKEIGKEAKAI